MNKELNTELTDDALAALINETLESISALEIEKRELPEKLQAAIAGGNVAQTVAARQRSDEIDLYLDSTRLRLEQLRLQAATRQVPQLKTTLAELQPQLAAAKKRLEKAAEEHNQLVYEASTAQGAIYDNNLRIADTKRRLDELTAKALGAASHKIVRMAPSALRPSH